ncbi:MAG: hypothetical protein U0795_25995 [Pirellulales bacterium]
MTAGDLQSPVPTLIRGKLVSAHPFHPTVWECRIDAGAQSVLNLIGSIADTVEQNRPTHGYRISISPRIIGVSRKVSQLVLEFDYR